MELLLVVSFHNNFQGKQQKVSVCAPTDRNNCCLFSSFMHRVVSGQAAAKEPKCRAERFCQG